MNYQTKLLALQLIEEVKAGIRNETSCALQLKKLFLQENVELNGLKPLEYGYLLSNLRGACLQCNKPTTFKSIKLGYSSFCSTVCGAKGSGGAAHAIAVKQGVLKKHGVENAFMLPEVVEKIKRTRSKIGEGAITAKRKATCLAKYGTEHAITKTVISKTQQTALARYGVENVAQLEQVKLKSAITKEAKFGIDFNKAIYNLSKQSLLKSYGVENNFQRADVIQKNKLNLHNAYGVEHPMHSDAVKLKLIKTVQDRYGVNNVRQAEHIKSKIHATMLKRYGVKYALQNVELMNKLKQTNLTRYGATSYLATQECQALARAALQRLYNGSPATNSDVKAKIAKTVTLKNLKRNAVKFAIRLAALLSHGYSLPDGKAKAIDSYINNEEYQLKHDSCGTVYPVLGRYRYRGCSKCCGSLLQNKVEGWIKELSNDKVLINDRAIIKPFEIDLWIPTKSLGIEVHGDYYHSSNFKDDDYHEMKHILACSSEISLIQLFEHELEQKPEICYSMLAYKLGAINVKYGARTLSLRTVSVKDRISFFNENHLQGDSNAKVALGLWANNELIACMSFGKPRFDKHHDWELIRYSSRLMTAVPGGAARLLKAFRAQYNGSIITYADARYSTGELYKALGFKQLHKSQPNYWYVKGGNIITRYQAMKHMLPKLLGEKFDPLLTEAQNMNKNGWYRLFDCGNYVFELT